MLPLINRESKTIVGAAAIVGILSFASRFVGLFRDRILAGTFGAGETLDMYYAAFKIPDLFFQLIVVGALSASFIPLFTNQYRNVSKQEAWKFTNNILHLLGMVVVGITIVLMIFARPLASLVAPGFDAIMQNQVAGFMRIMFLSQILLAGSMVFGSMLQSLKRFILYAVAPIVYNAGIIIGALVFVDHLGPIGLAWGVVFGALLHVCLQFYGAYQVGYRYSFLANWRSADAKEMARMTMPRMLSIGVSQLLFITLSIMATTMGTGSVTMFQFAYNIQFFPVGIIGISYAIAAFPAFSEHLGEGRFDDFRESFSSTVRQVLFFMVPMMLLFLIMRTQVVRIIVGAGAFDWNATITTADALAFFALTCIPQALVFILARAFFALRDTATPLTAGIVSTLFGIISAFLLESHFGVVGLAMAYSFAALVNATLLWVPLRTRVGSLDELRILQAFMKITIAGLGCAIVMQLLKPVTVQLFSLNTLFGVLMQVVVAGGAGMLVYLVLAHFLKVEELRLFVSAMHRRILNKSMLSEPAQQADSTSS